MSKRARPHWRAHSIIVAALLCAIVLAIGHHLFYQSLVNKPAPNDVVNILGTNVSKQQINIAGGTAFALLVKAFLVIALSTVFAQLLWLSIARHASHELTLGTLDTIWEGPANLFALWNISVWWRFPLLFLIVLMIWYGRPVCA